MFSKMYITKSGRSLWKYTLFFTFLQLWGRISASTSPPNLPAPVLEVLSRSSTSVVLVCRAPVGHHGVLFMLYRMREQVDSQEHQPGTQEVHFSVSMKDSSLDERELFCCLYKNNQGFYSAFSPYLQLDHNQDLLPVPTLLLQQQTDMWHLVCRGSPAYPGAVFSLYLVGSVIPVTTHHAHWNSHQATFPVPVQDSLLAHYQCQYSVLLGSKWANSERSLPLDVVKGISPPPEPEASGVDWPLVLGSLSAVVLFLCSVALTIVVAHRKVKASAEEKKKRQEAQFWAQVHSKDHVIDLTLRRSSFISQPVENLALSIQARMYSSLVLSHCFH
ncbi:uncharacterized protein LOC117526994 isoform X2 [Thalassophryne amazonica]|uniref:uncharacterized protein LOC117526994 isoform X2 n=1 Tax=Thalassophryne amazonica TaxID=390379 RepID=UPI0014725F67|nr:uncharacterized protein LOC117526994 isoform X2 [Thalassophryne amazonica]